MSITSIPKICVPVDRFFYGPNKGAFPKPRSPLFDQADAFVIKHHEYLRAYRQLTTLGQDPSGLERQELSMLKRVIASGRDVIFHSGTGLEDHTFIIDGSTVAGDRGFGEIFLEQGYINDLKGVGRASFSLSPSSRNQIVDMRTGFWNDDRETWMTERSWMDFFRGRLMRIRSSFRGELGFENTPLHPGYQERGIQRFIASPEFISSVMAEDPGLYFLLDVAHAKVSSWQFGCYDTWRFLERFPLGLVRELHVSGTTTDKGAIHEAHSKPQQEDFELLSWLFRMGINPLYLTIEDYRADEEGLSRDIDEMKGFLATL